MAEQTPRLKLPYPDLTDTADGPAAFRALALALDSVGMYAQGSLEAMPLPASVPNGFFYFALDQGVLYNNTGTAFIPITSSAPVDGPANVASLRTLGGGAQQAASGTDPRLSDQRVPLDASVTKPKLDPSLVPSEGASGGAEALRALGLDAGKAAPGIHAAQHAPAHAGGADPIDYSHVHLVGTDAARQALDPSLVPFLLWYSTDIQVLWLSDGARWNQASSSTAIYLNLSQFPPANPFDGMRVFLDLEPSPWTGGRHAYIGHFRYNAGSDSAYKWEHVGAGPSIIATVNYVGQGYDTSAWHHLASVDSGWLTTFGTIQGPSIYVPRSGEYWVKMGGRGYVTHQNARGWLGLSGAGIDPTAFSLPIWLPYLYPNDTYREFKATLIGGQNLSLAYRIFDYLFISGAYYLYMGDRFLEIVPIRVS